MSEIDSFLNPGQSPAKGVSGQADDEDNLVLNLEDVDDSRPDFVPLPPGVYDAEVDNVEYGPSNSGNPMLTWTIKVIDEKYSGRLLWTYHVLNKQAGVARLKRTLIRLGIELDMATFSPRQFCDEGVAIGLPCRVRVNVRPYQGKKRNNVLDILAPGGSEGSFLRE